MTRAPWTPIARRARAVLVSLVAIVSSGAAATPLLAQTPTEGGPDPERVEAVVDELERAFDGSETTPKVRALEAAGEVPAPEVVDAIVRGLREKEREVKQAVIQALRWMDHPNAVVALRETFEKNRALREDEEFAPALLKAIGQHGDPGSLRLLQKDALGGKNHATRRARLLGLGMIRERASIEALLQLMRGTDERKVERAMDDLRLSLMMLTGTDRGPSAAAWRSWWSDHAKDFVLPAEPPRLPPPFAAQWYNFWGLDKDHGRAPRREERGEDRAPAHDERAGVTRIPRGSTARRPAR